VTRLKRKNDMTRYHRNTFPPLPDGIIIKGWGAPYALVVRGGLTPGKRPATALAFIVSARSDDGGRTIKMRALIRRGDGWSKPRPLDFGDIVCSWRNPPAPATIDQVRGKLDKVERK
jgi:hypothetical protein